MKTQNIWLLRYVTGNPEIYTKVITDAQSPLKRNAALEAAQRIANNGWRCWVEHKDTAKRIFESPREIQWKSKLELIALLTRHNAHILVNQLNEYLKANLKSEYIRIRTYEDIPGKTIICDYEIPKEIGGIFSTTQLDNLCFKIIQS